MSMKPNIVFSVHREPPAEALSRFTKASLEAATAIPQQGTLSVVTNLHSDNAPLEAPGDGDALPSSLATLVERLESDPFERLESLTATWRNGNDQLTAKLEDKNQGSNTEVRVDGKGQLAAKVEAVVSALRKVFEPHDFKLERFQGLPTELREFHLSQEEVFSRREAELLAGHKELRESIVEAQKEAQQEIQRFRDQFDERDRQREENYQSRLSDLEEREEALRQEKADFDDRERTHARRKHQENFQAVLERHREFKHSAPTTRKRLLIHVASWAALASSVALYLHAILRAAGPDLFTVLPATLLFGSTLTFYLMWMKAWSDSHARAESAARSFEEDFSRAYWLAEFLFEWGELDKQPELPGEVLGAFSRGLFSVQRGSQIAPAHPVMELLGRVPNVKKFALNKDSVTVETDSVGEESSKTKG